MLYLILKVIVLFMRALKVKLGLNNIFIKAKEKKQHNIALFRTYPTMSLAKHDQPYYLKKKINKAVRDSRLVLK